MGVIWEVFFPAVVCIPLLKAEGGTEAISCIYVLVLYLGINRYVTMVAIIVVHILLLLVSVGVTTGRMWVLLNSV
jgi:hypothetical protein